MRGFVVRLRTDKGYGFIREGTAQAPQPGEWFFHTKDCDPMSPFNSLQELDTVEFTPTETVKGPRALHVVLA